MRIEAAVALLVVLNTGCVSNAAAQLTAITNITVIDGTGRSAQPDMTVLIRDRLIADIFRSGQKPLPDGAVVLSGGGRYLIPGLIDSHVHNGTIEDRPQRMTEAMLKFALLGGITSVRDMGGRTSNVQSLAQRAAHDTTPWPRIFTSAIIAGDGGWFEGRRGAYMAEGGDPGSAPLVRRVTRMQDIAPAIAAARGGGATGIKLYNNIAPELLAPIAAEARRNGLRVWSHLVVDPGKPSDVVRAGVDAVSHADMFIREILPWPPSSISRDSARAIRHRAFLAATPDMPAFAELLKQMRDRGTALDATLFIMTPRPDSTGAINEQAASLYGFATAMVRKANGMGIMIVAGTDELSRPAPNVHAELQLLVDRAGLTEMQALQAATINAARVLGAQESIGTIEKGKRADLVILRQNPLEDIANTLSIVTVVKGGRMFHLDAPVRTPPHARPPRTR